MHKQLFTIAALSMSLYLAPVGAHHAVQAQFDQDNLATISGTMTRVMWINPHVRWFMDVTDDNGNVTSWNISGAAPGAFRGLGINGREVFKAGEEYTATVALARDGSNFGYVVNFVLPDGRQLDLWQEYRSEGGH
jgi:hypothetical protein